MNSYRSDLGKSLYLLSLYYTITESLDVTCNNVICKTWSQCYKTLIVGNLQIFALSYCFCQSRPFRPSLMFVGKARSLSK
jgi:hypothetical protein